MHYYTFNDIDYSGKIQSLLDLNNKYYLYGISLSFNKFEYYVMNRFMYVERNTPSTLYRTYTYTTGIQINLSTITNKN